MTEKVLTAIVSALAGGVFTFSMSAVRLEGRVDAIEKSLTRIEQRLVLAHRNGVANDD